LLLAAGGPSGSISPKSLPLLPATPPPLGARRCAACPGPAPGAASAAGGGGSMASADAAVKPETVDAASPRGDEPSDIVYPTVSPRTDPATLAAALDALRPATGA